MAAWPFIGSAMLEDLATAAPFAFGATSGFAIGALLILSGGVLFLIVRRGPRFVPRADLDSFLFELLSRRGYEFPAEGVSAHGVVRARHSGGCVLVDLRALQMRRIGPGVVRRLIRELRKDREAQSGVLLTQGAISDRARALARTDRVALVDVHALRESLAHPPAPSPTAQAAPAPKPRPAPAKVVAFEEDDLLVARRGSEPPHARPASAAPGDLSSALSRPSGSPPRHGFDTVEARLRVENPGESQFGRRRDRPAAPADWDDLLGELAGERRPARPAAPRDEADDSPRRPDLDPWGDGQ